MGEVGQPVRVGKGGMRWFSGALSGVHRVRVLPGSPGGARGAMCRFGDTCAHMTETAACLLAFCTAAQPRYCDGPSCVFCWVFPTDVWMYWNRNVFFVCIRRDVDAKCMLQPLPVTAQ